MRAVKEKEAVYTLQEVQERLNEPQHRLIHLCEKEVIVPDIEDAQGRGTMRRFSERNLFEFAVALELRRFLLPLGYIEPILQVLRSFEVYAAKEIAVFRLPQSLQEKPAIRLHLVITEGKNLYFVLKHKGETRYLGGLDLTKGRGKKSGFHPLQISSDDPTQSASTRLEVDLTKIAQGL